MTADDFRRIALALTGVVEGAHHGHADFRASGRIFGSLGYPDEQWGMVILTPDQQRTFVTEHPGAFVPVKGTWGEQGSTSVRLDAVNEEAAGEALTLAHQNAVRKGPTRTWMREHRTPSAAPRQASRRTGRR